MEDETTLPDSFKESLNELSLDLLQEDVELDIKVQDASGDSCFHKAVEENQEAVVDALLSRNVDIEIKNEDGETPLMLAVRLGNEIMVEKLIKNGANVDTEDIYYNTPLLHAVVLNRENIVDLLLKNGASCLVENKSSQTPLHMAIIMNFESVFDKLVDAGSDVNITNSKYGTPIEAALTAVNLRIARKLLAQGASLSPLSVFSSLLNCYMKNFMTLFNFILENGFDVSAKGSENWSLLHLAVTRQNVMAVGNLLKAGANVNAKDNNSETPLHFAVRLDNCSIVKLLLEYKSDVNAKNIRGRTALYVAVQSFREETVRLLLNAGADMNIPQNSGCSPLDLLARLFSKKVTSYMLCARKMDLAKMRINLAQNDGTFPKNFTTVSAFEAKCNEELDQIKAKKFGETSSLYTIFSDSSDPLFASNSDMEVYVKSNAINKDFPLYGTLLRRKFKEGVKRNILLDNLSLSVRIVQGLNVTHIILPREMSRKILVYLADYDILNVKKAFIINKHHQK